MYPGYIVTKWRPYWLLLLPYPISGLTLTMAHAGTTRQLTAGVLTLITCYMLSSLTLGRHRGMTAITNNDMLYTLLGISDIGDPHPVIIQQ